MRHTLITILALLAAAGQAAELDMRFDFEGTPGAIHKNTSCSANSGAFARFVPVKGSDTPPELVADAPEALQSFSRQSIRGNRGLIRIKRDEAPFAFSKPFSFQLWFKAEPAMEKLCYLATFNKSWRLGFNPAGKRFILQNLAGKEKIFSTPVNINDGAWHLLTITSQPGKVAFYIDGNSAGTRAVKKGFADSVELFLGNGSPYGPETFNGLMDELRLFRGVLTVPEIRAFRDGKKPEAKLPEGKLRRLASQDYPIRQAYEPRRTLSFADAVIVSSAPDIDNAVQKRLAEAWQKTFPILSCADALKSGKPLILCGNAGSNRLLRRLAANLQLAAPANGYELRTMPDMLDWHVDGLYFGGRTVVDVEQALNVFLSRYPTPSPLPVFVTCETAGTLMDAAAMVDAMRRHYAAPSDYIPNQSAIRLLRAPAQAFRRSGRAEYARAFGDMVKVILDNYDRHVDSRGTPPSFTFHEFPWMVDSVEESEAFTAEDRLNAANLMLKAVENMLSYWEMTLPMSLYNAGKTRYLTNHYIFASRSVYMAADYLETHYQYAPAAYWKAVAVNTMDGIANEPFSPEDSANYQYIVYRIFTDYAIASGRYTDDFFRNQSYRTYIDYVKALAGTDGLSAGYGDGAPLDRAGHWSVLRDAMLLFGDQEAEFILRRLRASEPESFFRTAIDALAPRDGLPEPGIGTLGLNLFANNAFRETFYNINGLFRRPTLDKAIFRSSWDKATGEHITINGMSGAPHGHLDVAGLSRYQRGQHLWVTEGDYILKYPDEHNTVAVNCDAVAEYPAGRHSARSAQIVGSVNRADRKQSLLSLEVADYNGTNWTRDYGYLADAGLWVIDTLESGRDGEFLAECRWRLLGEPEQESPETLVLRQKNGGEFRVHNAAGTPQTLHSQLDAGHEEPLPGAGYYARYPLAAPKTRVVTQRHSAKLNKGDKLYFANYLQSSGKPESVRRIAPNAFRTDDSVMISGSLTLPQITVKAAGGLITPHGITATGATRIRMADVDFRSDKPQDVALPLSAQAFATLPAGCVAQTPKRKHTAALPLAQRFDAPVSALAGADDRFAVGLTNGTLIGLNPDGTELFRRSLPGSVTAVAVFSAPDGKRYFAAGCAPAAVSTRTAAAGTLALFDANGKELWSRAIAPLQRRNGTVRVILPLKRGKTEWALTAGSESWQYFAFSPSGDLLWKRQVYHGATTAAAADLDADGREELAPGVEYYYHQIFDADGKELDRKTTAPHDFAMLATDLT